MPGHEQELPLRSRPLLKILAPGFLFTVFILLFFAAGSSSQDTLTLHLSKELLLKLASDNLGQLDPELSEQLRQLNPQYSHITITHDDPRVDLELGLARRKAYFRLKMDKYQLNKLAMDYQNVETGKILEKISKDSGLGEMAFQRAPKTLSLYIALRPGTRAKVPPLASVPPSTPSPPPATKTPQPLPEEEEAPILLAVRTAAPPVIDGDDGDEIWQQAPLVRARVRGASGNREVELKACYTDTHLYLLARWWDNTKNDTHMTWVWDKAKKEYVSGNDRQDALAVMFAFKGSFKACMLEGKDYAADLWMWGAAKTNPAGYAEDGTAVISTAPLARANAYKGRWLKIVPDGGELPYKSQIPLQYQGDTVPRYLPQTPTQSAADVRARGRWSDNTWVVEFGRRLKTGHDDDVILTVGQPVAFALALYDHRDGDKHSISKELTLRWR